MKLATFVLVAVTCLSTSTAAVAGNFTLKSNDIADGATLDDNFVYAGFGCTGKNISPQLSWSNAPEGTKSFAITVYDGNAPTGSGWWHWMVVNIDSSQSQLAQAASSQGMPKGAVQIETDFGEQQFGGACPPVGHGKHTYQFKVHALKVEKLDVTADTPAALVGYMLWANSLGTAQFNAYYER